jgi:PAS domain S-box-containing protein
MNNLKSVRKEIKRYLQLYNHRHDLYLALLDEKGYIVKTNRRMKKHFHLHQADNGNLNFCMFLHPLHTEQFNQALRNTLLTRDTSTTELYLKNGIYQPMKWQVNWLPVPAGSDDSFLFFCIGYPLMEKHHFSQFREIGQNHYQHIVESMNSGVLLHSPAGELIAANEKAARILELSLERLYQLKNINRILAETWQVYDENGQLITQDELPLTNATGTALAQKQLVQLKNLSGKEKWIYFNSQAVPDEQYRKVKTIITTLQDITEEKKWALRCQQSEAMFRAFMNANPNLCWVVNEEAEIIFINDALARFYNINRNLQKDERITDLVPASVTQALYEKHLRVLESGQPMEFTEKTRLASGRRIVILISLFPVEASSGQRWVGGQAVNVADTYETERQLREMNERLLYLSQAASAAIWEWDMKSGVIYRNEALMEMIGYIPDDGKGLSWWLRRIHPEDRNRVSDKIKETTDAGRQFWEDEYRFKHADGTYKHIKDKGFVIYENGLPVRMIGSLNDISELTELNNRLADEKLKHQKELSETVIRAQEKERTRIGHELHDNVNQILSTVKLFVDLIKPAGEDDRQMKSKSLEYLVSAINEIRALSKELVAPQLRRDTLIDSIRALIHDVHQAHSMKIKFVHDHETEKLSYDKKVTLFRIVQEQIKNILKYSKATQVDMILQTRNGTLQLLIKDNGIGFDPGQTHNGIGLSNIHDRTQFYQGKAEIESAPGKGCTLKVELPVA